MNNIEQIAFDYKRSPVSSMERKIIWKRLKRKKLFES